ncbi:MAG TPA: HypC/HybG/HupF family hydrogenase formation chaperone [Rhodoferax sp.]|nr:HypC/HybG/HupF family hydrogenase formation chaperone [Rhodoferax sp.]
MCLGLPGQIVEIISSDMQLAMVDVGGVRRAVNISLLVDDEHPVSACLGDWVLVHLGFARLRIDENEAAATVALLLEIGKLQSDIDRTRTAQAT